MSIPEYIYRFRPIRHLLGNNELENQEIFFAHREKLNDPLEGYKDFFWQGDEIVWHNLLKNYLLCLEHACSFFVTTKKDDDLTKNKIWPLMIIDDLPEGAARDFYLTIQNSFFSHPLVSKYPSWLASLNSPIRKNELIYHLRQLHFFALDHIFTIYELNGLPAARNRTHLKKFGIKFIEDQLKSKTLSPLAKNDYEAINIRERKYAAANHSLTESHILFQLNEQLEITKNREFLLHDFPEAYVKSLESLIHTDWYAASFLGSCKNPALWGYYADNHKGVCLKFKTRPSQDQQVLNLNGVVGFGGARGNSKYINGEIRSEIYKINYKSLDQEIDFFASIGRLSEPNVVKYWYSIDGKGLSTCSTEYFSNKAEWRKRHWQNLYSCVTTKLPNWSHEEEYRLILSGFMDYTKEEHRKLTYELSELDGIIFGEEMATSDKLEILRMMRRKVPLTKGAKIKFYQATHFRGDEEIGIIELPSLQLESPV